MKHIKMLGLVAFSAMALVALLGTASASASSFTSPAAGTTLKSKTLVQHIFTITNNQVKCSTTSFEGKTEGTKKQTEEEGKTGTEVHTESQIVHPVYEGCEAFGFKEGVTVTTKGCDYTFNANTTAEMGVVKVIDHTGETCTGIVIKVEIPFTKCVVSVGKQELASAVSYANNAGKIKVKATATAIATNVTTSEGLCPLTTGLHTGANGATYTGESEVEAEGSSVTYTP
jgi:hypothetical protein